MLESYRESGYDETFTDFAIWSGNELPEIIQADLLPDQILGATMFTWTIGMAKHANVPLQGPSITLPALYSKDSWEAICPDSTELMCTNPVCQGQNGRCTTSLMSMNGEGCECEDCPSDDDMVKSPLYEIKVFCLTTILDLLCKMQWRSRGVLHRCKNKTSSFPSC